MFSLLWMKRHSSQLCGRAFSSSEEKARLVRQLSESRGFTVRQILETQTQNLNTVNENAPISLAAKIMVQEEVGSLMVTASDGSLTGIVTERDYLRASQNEYGGNVVSDIMTSRQKLITVRADTTLTACVNLMAQHQFRHLPVLEGTNLVGLIGSSTLLYNFLQYHEIQVAHLENFLPYPVW